MQSQLILPIDGKLMVCRHTPDGLMPRAPIPGTPDAVAFHEPGSLRVAIMDSGRKRVGLFELMDEEPWIRRILPFANLPKDCTGDVALAVGDGIVVGGHSKSGEAVWWRHPTQATDHWQALDLPKEIKRPKKSIDGLHLDGRRLIAVDDVVVPRWLVLYDLQDDETLTLRKKVLLPAHFPYEQIVDSFLGEKTLWFVSRGARQGQGAAFVWGVDRESFVERGSWSSIVTWPTLEYRAPAQFDPGENNAGGDEEDSEKYPGAPAIFFARRAVEWENNLLVACQQRGLLMIPLERKRTNFKQTDPSEVPVPELATVEAIRVVPGGGGVYLIGKNAGGQMTSVWKTSAEMGAV